MRRRSSGRSPAPVVEREEYVLGTVCGAVPVTVGGGHSAVGFSLPVAEEDRLEETALRLRGRLERVLTDRAFAAPGRPVGTRHGGGR
ncbi:hypothetical protein ACFV2S_29040 [Streptomyces sp. NPDC059695]|uniref:hypothetical protein n=1 Tax=Streptomyces sp. NPDC059695 TaxID=3346910 RepID=UPI0036AAC43F